VDVVQVVVGFRLGVVLDAARDQPCAVRRRRELRLPVERVLRLVAAGGFRFPWHGAHLRILVDSGPAATPGDGIRRALKRHLHRRPATPLLWLYSAEICAAPYRSRSPVSARPLPVKSAKGVYNRESLCLIPQENRRKPQVRAVTIKPCQRKRSSIFYREGASCLYSLPPIRPRPSKYPQSLSRTAPVNPARTNPAKRSFAGKRRVYSGVMGALSSFGRKSDSSR
jgi:hypothetical protein